MKSECEIDPIKFDGVVDGFITDIEYQLVHKGMDQMVQNDGFLLEPDLPAQCRDAGQENSIEIAECREGNHSNI